jgi:hypothetical protein
MSPAAVQVMIVPCESGPDAWTHQSEILRAHFPADPQLRLVQEADRADIILITDLRDRGDDFANLRHHPLVRGYPDKCFTVTDVDEPPRWVPGMHTSATKSLLNLRRFHSGSYFLTHPDFRNRFIDELAELAPEQLPERRILFSFLGRACNPLRRRMLQRRYTRLDVVVKDTSAFNAFTHDPFGKASAQREYAEVLATSKFAVCPRGAGAASIRLFEAMSLGVCPVILSNDWILPRGPDWKSFALFVDEDDDANLEAIITQHEPEWRERGQRAREVFHQFFTGPAYARYLIDSALDLQRRRVVPERLVQLFWPPALVALKVQRRLARLRHRTRPGDLLGTPDAQRAAH